ncbi:MAG TPA: biopolymer transporter ExbD [Armatimonadota bacterium]|nr:biopolymer transporter ExbD [Armatimonadota bacterium]
MEFRKRREMKRTKIEIIPMIDTIFFLLVFFMLSSLALTRLNGLPVDLPKASTATQQAAQDVTITIDAQRRIFVNKDPATPENVGPLMLAKAGGPKTNLETATVLINADASVPHGLVIHCIDEARKVGLTHFGIMTAPEGQSGGY